MDGDGETRGSWRWSTKEATNLHSLSLCPTSIQVFNYLPKGERGNVNPLFRKFCFDVSLSTSQRRTCSDKHLAEECRQTITMG